MRTRNESVRAGFTPGELPARQPKQQRRHGRFTIVELLVVIAVILILVSMLMPALGDARLQARTVQTVSNMKQIYSGVLLYAGSNDRVLCMADANPHPYCSDGADFPRMIAEEIRGKKYHEDNDQAKIEMDEDGLYKGLMWCPVIRGIRGYTEPHNNGRSDYSWNRYFGKASNNRRLSNLDGDIEPFMVPGTAQNSGQSASNLKQGTLDPTSQGHPAYVYSNRALFMYIDGSLKKVTVQDGSAVDALINDRNDFQ